MKIIRSKNINFIPASHEDPNDPGVLKKILLEKNDIVNGKIQMINWAKLLPNKEFVAHYHEDMEEIFIILNGRAKFVIDDKVETVGKGDIVVVPIKEVHKMKNETDENIEYIVMGIATGVDGKTVVV